MPLIETIETDIKNAMKSKDADKLSTLRMLKAAVLNDAIQKKKNTLEDSEILEVIQKQAKQRRESIDNFQKAGRTELAAKEQKELEILQSYLPKQLTEDELKVLIQAAIQSSGAQSKADLGKVMKALLPQTKGKADGKAVNELVQKMLP